MPDPGRQPSSTPTRDSVRTLEGQTPSCPRCGYDLSVSTQLWPEDRCPAHSTCSECGLDFAWSEVMHPSRRPPWLVGARLSNPLAWVRAVFVPLMPFRAMRGAPLSLPVKPAREVAAPAVLGAVWYLLVVLATRLEVWLFNPQPIPPFWNVRGPLAGYNTPYYSPTWTESLFWPFTDAGLMLDLEGLYVSFTLLPVLMMLLITPVMFLTLGTTMRRAKVRPVHLVRLLGISAMPVVGVMLFQLVSRATLSALEYEGLVTLPNWEWLRSYIEWHEWSWYGSPLTSWPVLTLLAFLCWFGALWYGACRWYLRLPSPGLHAAVLFGTSLLATVSVLMATHEELRQWLYGLAT